MKTPVRVTKTLANGGYSGSSCGLLLDEGVIEEVEVEAEGDSGLCCSAVGASLLCVSAIMWVLLSRGIPGSNSGNVRYLI